MTVALITHPACLAHDTGPCHPECAGPPARRAAGAGGRGLPAPAARVRRRKRDRGAARPGPSRRLRARHPRDPARAGRDVALDADTLMSPGSRGGGAARGRRRGDGGGRGDGRLGAPRLRRHPPARPPRRARRADGLLPVRQRRHRRAPRPGALGAAARRGGRFRRPSRQRHAGHLRRRPGPVLCLHPPVAAAIPAPAAPAERGVRQHRQRPARRRARTGAEFRAAWDAPHAAGAGRVRAGAADRFRRLRRPPGATRWPSCGWRPRISRWITERLWRRRRGIAAAAWCRCWRAATTSTRSPPAPPPMSGRCCKLTQRQ